MTKSISYSDAGVSIDKANEAVSKIREFAKATFNERTLTEIGSFGGMFSAAFPEMSEPVLVASADGVGTKLKVAFLANVRYFSAGRATAFFSRLFCDRTA
jgi:phosphoribosylformylglycinamidine cyclo-ligase